MLEVGKKLQKKISHVIDRKYSSLLIPRRLPSPRISLAKTILTVSRS